MGNVPLVEAEVVVFCELVLEVIEVEVVEAVLLVVVALVVFDDDVDGDEVDGDDVVVPVFKGLLVLVHTPWALQLP